MLRKPVKPVKRIRYTHTRQIYTSGRERNDLLLALQRRDHDRVHDVLDRAAAREVVHRLGEALHDGPHRDGLRGLLDGLVAVVARVEVGEHAHGGVARDLRVGPLVLDGRDVGVDGRVELDRPLDGVLAAQALGLGRGLTDRVDERALVTCAESNFTAPRHRRLLDGVEPPRHRRDNVPITG